MNQSEISEAKILWEQGLTYQQIANMLNKGKSTICRWLNRSIADKQRIQNRQRNYRRYQTDQNFRESCKKYRDSTIDQKRVYNREYDARRKFNDINYRLRCNLRTRLWQALRGNYKSGSAVRDLGCSIEELKYHLESQFQEGMSWDNYGEWHIDHIKPLASFDLSDHKQLLGACHYTNLQPLWAEENIKKGCTC